MSNGSPASDAPLEHEPVDEDRPADPDESLLGPVPEDERPVDPADLVEEPPLDDERRVRLDDTGEEI
ncbi:hypothetical protein [Microbacterium lushaniae]|uniref:Uncharacterized protein n=1 Tax=Microbacterium lushaniae TaxID=2614639 RepID=A0A5J6L0I7_9MICO|nr:hypothetical protein [Microbacterium lushaniae]QEW02013.1 hypothetical protein F6J85_02125 [Microbacterium lushaniae]